MKREVRHAGSPKVLVVDDDSDARRFLAEVLVPMGCDVSMAENGSEAVELVDSENWDMVLLDVNMPGLNGFQVLEYIRGKHPLEKLPVILVTAQDDADSRARGLALQANDFISKPVDVAELMARMGTMLKMRRAVCELEERVDEVERQRRYGELMMNYVVNDLRAALNGANVFLQLAMVQLDNDESPAGSYMRNAVTSIDRGANIAADVLDMTSRMDTDKFAAECAPADLAELAACRIRAVMGICELKRVAIESEMRGDIPRIPVNQGMISRAMEKLILFGVRRTDPGGRVRIALRRNAGDDRVLFGVTYVETVLAESQRNRLFDREFYAQLRRSGIIKEGGTGAGPVFSRLAVEMHGGRTWVQCGAEGATTLWFILPGPTEDAREQAIVPKVPEPALA